MNFLIKIDGPAFFLLFFSFVFLYAVLMFSMNTFIYTDSVYFQSLGDHLNLERISKLVSAQRKWEWVGYVLLPLILLTKILFTSTCLFISSFLGNIDIYWRDLFGVALFSELVFVIAGVFRLAWLLYFPTTEIDVLNNFSPLSLLQLLPDGLPDYLRHAFRTVNIFEFFYWVLLANGVQVLTGKGFVYSFGLVAKGYGTGLLLWMLFVAFLVVQFS